MEALARMKVVNRTRATEVASSIEIAGHGEARRVGLLGRDRLEPGGGLWIAPCEAVHTVGMRFPIDLVYLDRKRRVRKTRRAVGPWRLSACLAAHSVLELPAGMIDQSQTQPGDFLEFAACSSTAEASNDQVLSCNTPGMPLEKRPETPFHVGAIHLPVMYTKCILEIRELYTGVHTSPGVA